MAKDDYFVIVYQILAYLYQCLKSGKNIEPRKLQYCGELFSIKENYWRYIIFHMQQSGLIEGVEFVTDGYMTIPYVGNLEGCMITPDGIEYLCDNSFMEKAKKFLKTAKEITPFA